MLPAAAIDKWNASLQEMKRQLEFQGNMLMDKYASMEQRVLRIEAYLKDSNSIPNIKKSGSVYSLEHSPQIPRSVYLMSPKPFVTLSPNFVDNTSPSSPPASSDKRLSESATEEEPPSVAEANTDERDSIAASQENQDVEQSSKTLDTKESDAHLQPGKRIARQAQINDGQSQESLLRSAAKSGDHEELTRLISSGVDPNAKSDTGHTALHLAIMKNRFECMKILLESGADVNEADKFGQTPLIKASSCGNADCVSLLLEWGARISLKDHNGRSALHAASAWGHSQCVVLLLNAGISVGERDNGGRTPLHVAVASNRAETVRTLLKAGADKKMAANDGRTPEDFAVSEDVKFLLWK